MNKNTFKKIGSFLMAFVLSFGSISTSFLPVLAEEQYTVNVKVNETDKDGFFTADENGYEETVLSGNKFKLKKEIQNMLVTGWVAKGCKIDGGEMLSPDECFQELEITKDTEITLYAFPDINGKNPEKDYENYRKADGIDDREQVIAYFEINNDLTTEKDGECIVNTEKTKKYDVVKKGEKPSFLGEVNIPDGYELGEWDKEITEINKNTTYKAEILPKKYTFYLEDSVGNKETINARYGDSITFVAGTNENKVITQKNDDDSMTIKTDVDTVLKTYYDDETLMVNGYLVTEGKNSCNPKISEYKVNLNTSTKKYTVNFKVSEEDAEGLKTPVTEKWTISNIYHNEKLNTIDIPTIELKDNWKFIDKNGKGVNTVYYYIDDVPYTSSELNNYQVTKDTDVIIKIMPDMIGCVAGENLCSSTAGSDDIDDRTQLVVNYLNESGETMFSDVLKKDSNGKASAKNVDAPAKKGHTFVSWDKSLLNLTTDTDFKPIYTINSYNVKISDDKNILFENKLNYEKNIIINDEDGKEIKRIVVGEQDIEEKIDNAAISKDDSLEFDKWEVVSDGAENDVIITPKYKTKTFVVTYRDFDDKVLNTQIVEYGKSSFFNFKPNSKTGHHFVKWDTLTTDVKNDIETYAEYEPDEYNITVYYGNENNIVFQKPLKYNSNIKVNDYYNEEVVTYHIDDGKLTWKTSSGNNVEIAMDSDGAKIGLAAPNNVSGYTFNNSWTTNEEAESVTFTPIYVKKNATSSNTPSVINTGSNTKNNTGITVRPQATVSSNINARNVTNNRNTNVSTPNNNAVNYQQQNNTNRTNTTSQSNKNSNYSPTNSRGDTSSVSASNDPNNTSAYIGETQKTATGIKINLPTSSGRKDFNVNYGSTVTFKDESGNVLTSTKVSENTNVKAPEAPKKEGYKFAGWKATEDDKGNVTIVAFYEEDNNSDFKKSAKDELEKFRQNIDESLYDEEGIIELDNFLKEAKENIDKAQNQEEVDKELMLAKNNMNSVKTIAEKNNDAKEDVVDDENEKNTKENGLAKAGKYILGGLAVAGVVGTGAYLISRKKRDDEEEEEESENVDDEEDLEDYDEDDVEDEIDEDTEEIIEEDTSLEEESNETSLEETENNTDELAKSTEDIDGLEPSYEDSDVEFDTSDVDNL